ncbi:hypothetical protein CQA18_24645, partial [Enterobacter hormaechei]
MDRCQKDSATIASCQLITQIFTAGNGNDGVVANVIFGVAHLRRKLIVRDANDIVAFRKEFGVFGEFMDRCQKDSATIASCQLITQIFTAGNGNDGVVA